jgi:hypothetical protein
MHDWKGLVATPSIPSQAAELADLDRRHLIRSIQNGAIKDRVIIVRGKGA